MAGVPRLLCSVSLYLFLYCDTVRTLRRGLVFISPTSVPQESIATMVTSSTDILGGSNSSVFECSNNETIPLVSRCDGAYNCKDHSDENDCAHEGLLFYTTISEAHLGMKIRRWRLSRICEVKGIYLSNNKEFDVITYHDCLQLNFFTTFGSFLYFRESADTGISKYVQMNRNFTNITTFDRNRNFIGLTGMAIDRITNNMYLLINERIEICSADCQVCTQVKNKFMKKTSSFALSLKFQSLFWIEEKASSNFYIGVAQMDGSNTKILQRHLAVSKYLTLDDETELLFWLESSVIYSMKFDGNNKKAVANADYCSSFTIFKDTLYWYDVIKRQILTCTVSNCTQPEIYRNITSNKSGQQVFAYDFSTDIVAAKTSNPCAGSLCSDLCLISTKNNTSCACDDRLGGTLSPDKMYCNNTTLIATYGNDFYVIGQAFSGSPLIRKKSLNIKSVSALTYDSIGGYIILAEVGEQSIYLMHPRDLKEHKIVDDGLGTITSLEFDDFGNNIYWINPEELAVKVISLNTFRIKTLLQGNSSYVPTDFTLAPDKGLMFVVFFKMNTATIERMSMDGQNYTKIVYHEEVSKDVGNLTIHYMRDRNMLIWTESETEEIKYAYALNEGAQLQFTDIATLGTTEKSYFSDSLTSMNGKIIWTEHTPEILWRNLFDGFTDLNTHRINLGKLETAPNKTLKVASIQTEKKKSPCHVKNGNCEQLCLASPFYSTALPVMYSYHGVAIHHSSQESDYVCSCAISYTPVNFSHCKSILDETADSSTMENVEDLTTFSPRPSDVTSGRPFTERIEADSRTDDDHQCPKPSFKHDLLTVIIFMVTFTVLGIIIAEVTRSGREIYNKKRRFPDMSVRLLPRGGESRSEEADSSITLNTRLGDRLEC